ncbi:hypothetical protein ALC57_04642 [Trachymyrmex cornetzi]|uniref:Uncharacterized protein n=1 Tax=Trachymyrmex cornetzi TaxID=471704 RepID=A0A195EDD3_9HYME|nr:hypothetical protein ALC57_04642 [Trachymyrmex cornetzi]
MRQVTRVGIIEHGSYLLPQADQILLTVLPKSADQDQETENRAHSKEDHRCCLTVRGLLSVITVHRRVFDDVNNTSSLS